MAGNETIYNWIRDPEPVVVKPPMHISKHSKGADNLCRSTFRVSRRKTGSFGKSSNREKPSNFLRTRRNKGVNPRIKVKSNFKYKGRTMPPVPSQTDRPVMGLTTTKNFIVANAVENILAVPMQRGSKKPDYLKKKDYGKVPEYLNMVKKDVAEEKRVIEEYFNQEKEDEDEGVMLGADERANLLKKLKAKWDDTNKKYQKITHNTKLDTIGKVRRKEAYEKGLDQLEKDIRLLSSKRPIIITKN